MSQCILIALLAPVGGCSEEEIQFCSDLRDIDEALKPVREDKASDDFDRVPDLLEHVADVYAEIDPLQCC